jgi:hypothetical protein
MSQSLPASAPHPQLLQQPVTPVLERFLLPRSAVLDEAGGDISPAPMSPLSDGVSPLLPPVSILAVSRLGDARRRSLQRSFSTDQLGLASPPSFPLQPSSPTPSVEPESKRPRTADGSNAPPPLGVAALRAAQRTCVARASLA